MCFFFLFRHLKKENSYSSRNLYGITEDAKKTFCLVNY